MKRLFCGAVLVMLIAAAAPCRAASFQYEKTDGMFQVRVDLGDVREFDRPLYQYQLDRAALDVHQVIQTLEKWGGQGLSVSAPQYTQGGLLIQKSMETDFFPDTQGKGAPAYTLHDSQVFEKSLSRAAGLLDMLGWPRMANPMTCMSLDALAGYWQDRYGPGVYQGKSAILQMKFLTDKPEGKKFITFQSSLDGYPLAGDVAQGGLSMGGAETAGSHAAFLLGPEDELLCAFLPFPFTVQSQTELHGPFHAWQDAIPAIVDRQIAFYQHFIAENRRFFPNIDALWAQNNTQVFLRVKQAEPAYRVFAGLIARPVWQICIEAEFVYSGEDPIQAVRAAMPGIEETLYYVDVQTGEITP